MKPTLIPATSTDPNAILIPATGLEVDSFLGLFLETTNLNSIISADSIFSFFGTIWSVYAIFAYIFSIFLLVLYVYASTRYKQLTELRMEMTHEKEKIYEERFKNRTKNNRLVSVIEHIQSEQPNDWKLAIIEADIILDETLKSAGYGGASLGERLRSISPNQLRTIDEAWQAHKVRNQVAHAGADFVLTKRLAEDTIKQYRRVFAELGVS